MPSKSLLRRGFQTEAERLSEKLRSELSISKFDPMDAFKLAEHLQIPVFTVDEAFTDNYSNPQYSIMSDTAKFSAFWMPNEDGEKIIIHNSNHSKFRQQSNIMHELAHILLGHQVPLEYAILCAELGLHYYNTKDEQEAKFLGGCLQITKAGLQWATKRYSVTQISEYYTASIEMVTYRIGVSGVGKVNKYKKAS